ncbi:MAG TPA: BTAD domain-containing putative transcriptional regulator [Spirochaetia bacterium]|nr:BTAD domain-containing putative transcriptional regulator [Spirochaetia bacterium]
MSVAEFSLFGMPRLELDGRAVEPGRKKSSALLYYMAAERGPLERSAAAGLLWPEFPPDRARGSLRAALLDIERAAGARLFAAGGSCLAFDDGLELRVDAAEFIRLSDLGFASRDGDVIPLLKSAADLYRGPFLSGFYLKDAYEFEDWQLRMSDRFRHRAARVLERLSEQYRLAGMLDEAADTAERLIAAAPLHEAGHRLVMLSLYDRGDAVAASMHYEEYAASLDRQLGIKPEPSLRDLHDAIRAAPARAPRRRADRLPTWISSFVGREAEIGALTRLLAERRLVTIVGAGGIGKTRLAVEAARSIADRYPDGIAYAELGAADDEDVLPRIASSMNLPLWPREDAVEFAERSRHRRFLLVMNTCDAALGACAAIAEALLSASPESAIVATSLEAIGADGEAVMELAPLGVPPDGAPADEALRSPAVRLFIDRASGFMPTASLEREAPDIARVCAAVDGLPLAIELAAARARALSIGDLARSVSTPLSLLSDDAGSPDARHRSLLDLFDWSWGFLDAGEERSLTALSVCRGGFGVEAVEAITGSPVARTMYSLVSKSMVAVVRNRPGVSRWKLLEPLRRYAEARLEASGGGRAARAVHRDYYIGLAARLGSGLSVITDAEALDAVQDDWANIVCAARSAIDGGDTAGPLSALLRLRRFIVIRNKGRDLRTLLAAAGLRSSSGDDTAAAALAELSALSAWLGEDVDEVRRQSGLASSLWRGLGDEASARRSELLGLGLGASEPEEAEVALARLRDSADWFSSRDEPWLRCEALFWIGSRLVAVGTIDWSLLRSVYDEASAAVDAIGDLEGRSSRAWLGLWVSRWKGDRDGVRSALREMGDCDAILGLGQSPAVLREWAGEDIVEESAAIATRPGHPASAIDTLIDAADIWITRGECDRAVSALEQARTVAAGQDAPFKACFLLYYEALTLFAADRRAEAFSLVEGELAGLEGGTALHRRASCFLAHLSLGLDDEPRALELHRRLAAAPWDDPDPEEVRQRDFSIRYLTAEESPLEAARFVADSLRRSPDRISTFEIVYLGAIAARAMAAAARPAEAYEAALGIGPGIRWRITPYHAVERYLVAALARRLAAALSPRERARVEALHYADPKRDGIEAYLVQAKDRLARLIGASFLTDRRSGATPAMEATARPI